jgi:hypothetical protein
LIFHFVLLNRQRRLSEYSFTAVEVLPGANVRNFFSLRNFEC